MSTQIIETGFDKVTPTYYQTSVSNFSNLINTFYLKNVTFEKIDRITLFIHDAAIQSFTGEFMMLYHELRTPQQKLSLIYDSDYIHIPFKKYLPYFDECKIVLELNTPVDDASLFIEYVFLEQDPEPAMMLIEQVQTVEFTNSYFNLNIKHPVKEFYISVKNTDGLYTPDDVNRIRLDINEFTKINETALYFRYVQPFDYHTRIQGNCFTYSFCLDPESEIPTGSINMGRVKNQNLYLYYKPNTGTHNVTVYAINYNILTPDGRLVYT